MHPALDADEILGGETPELVMRHKLVFNGLNAAEIGDQLAEEPFSPIADSSSVQRLLNSLFECLTMLERLIKLRSQVLILRNCLKFFTDFANLLCQISLHHF